MMRKTRFLVIAAIALLPVLGAVSCGSSPTTPTPPPTEEPPVEEPPVEEPPAKPTLTVSRILAFGDSLTEGASDGQPLTFAPWGLSSHTSNPATSYPYQLQEMLDEIYGANKVKVTNAGRGGEQLTGAAKERFIEELDDHNPQVLLLMHGVNSLNAGVQEQNNGGSITDEEIVTGTANLLDELIEIAKERKPGIRIMLATLPRQKTGLSNKTLSAHLIPDYNDEMRLNASEEGCDLIDIYAVIKESDLMPDGLHIDEAGNLKIAQAFYAKIKSRYHRNPPSTLR